jgi:PAS domain S-box-containing protein
VTDIVAIEWLPLFAGLAMTGLAVAYAAASTRVKAKVARLVDERTRQLQASELQCRKLSYAVEQCAVSVVVTDLDGKIEYVNPKFTSVTGYTATEAMGQTPGVLKSGRHSQEFYATLWETICRGLEWRGELCNRKKDGSFFWENTIIAPIRDQSGRITNYVAVKEDITERRWADDDMRKTQARLDCAMSIAKMGCWEWDLANDRIIWSKETSRIYGYAFAKKQVNFEFFLDCLHRDDRREVVAFVDASILSREEREFAVNFRIVRPDGLIHTLRALGKVVRRDDTGAPLCAVGTVTDITEQELVHETLKRQSHLIQQRQAQKMALVGQLTGGIAHEFNNLLQIISGHAGYAIQGLDREEERHEDLQQVLKAAERAASLTRQLLGFSRRQILERQTIDPNQVVQELVKMTGPVIGKHIAVECVLDPDVGCVWADAGELQQVLLNLCVNARDALPDGGKIILATERVAIDAEMALILRNCKAGDYAVIRVTDTGTGIPADVIEHIFEPFFTTKEVGKGTGLGLSVAQGIIEQHGGAIEVSSEPGRTTFNVYLPVADSIAAEKAKPEAAPSAAHGGKSIDSTEEEASLQNMLAPPFVPRKNAAFAERKATNAAGLLLDTITEAYAAEVLS